MQRSYYRRGRGPGWLDLDEVLAIFGARRRMAVKAYIELMARGEGPSYEDLSSIGQVVKGEEEFAIRRFEEAGEVEPRLRGLSEARVVGRDGSTLVRDLGRLEQRLTKNAAKRRRVTAIAGALGATSQ